MKPYMKEVLGEFSEEATTTAPMPATDNIFKVQDEKDGRPLPEK